SCSYSHSPGSFLCERQRVSSVRQYSHPRRTAVPEQQLVQPVHVRRRRDGLQVATLDQLRIQGRHKMNVIGRSQPHHPVCLVTAALETILERLFDFAIITIPVHVLLNEWVPGAVRTFGEEQNRSAWPQRPTGILESFVCLPQVDIKRKTACR